MKNSLNQLSFFNLDEMPKKVESTNKRGKKKEKLKSTTQLSMFDLITNIIEENKKEIIKTKPVKNKKDFNLLDKTLEGLGTIKKRISQNIAAIKLVKTLKSKGIYATFIEQDILAKFSGFGAMQEVFDDSKAIYSEERETLKGMLTPEELKSSRETVNNAFYTDKKIMDFMYNALNKLGFTHGGDILEPSCGIGNFFGAMPQAMKNASTIKGVEIDTLTGEIAKQLYQNCDIEIAPFEESLTYQNYYDLVIGNVPFGQYGVYDKEYNSYNLSIHNYFIVKSLDKLRKGGLLAVVTSKFTMDSANDVARTLMVSKSNIVACFRLPQGAFSEYAKTKAVTDIIILQKTEDNEYTENNKSFMTLQENGINSYYELHPENILGELEEKSCMYGMELVPILKDKTIEEALKEALAHVPENIYTASTSLKVADVPANNYDVKPFGYDFINGKLVQSQKGYLVEIKEVKNAKNIEQYKDFIVLKKHVHTVLQAQVHKCSNKSLDELLETMNVLYDRFVYNYGYIDSKSCKMKFKQDPDFQLLCALEMHSKGAVKKADIFYKRTIKNDLYENEILNAKDALSYCINRFGYVDMDFIKNIYKKEEIEIIKELDGLIFMDPTTNDYVIAATYLSGNVVEKLRVANELLNENPTLNTNIKNNIASLEQVQPAPLTYDQIELKLGTTFIPVEYYTEFLLSIMGVTEIWKKEIVSVEYARELDEYKVNGNGVVSYTENKQIWGTERRSACELVQLSLNSKSSKVYDMVEQDGKMIKVFNKEETINAEIKFDAIKARFKVWIYESPERRNTIEVKYNKLYNSFADKRYNGASLTLPGKNPDVSLRDYQKNVIARGVLENNSLLLFHHVGAGKSYEMMAIGMELKRLGICNKPLYVVPNHMVQSGQFYQEFLRMYPGAKLLAATSEDFAKANRIKLVSKIATGNWDGVIIGHSSLIKIPMSKEFSINVMQEEIDKIETAIDRYKVDTGKETTVKKLETALKNQKLKLQKLADSEQDNTILFEELGVDHIILDEAHNFKNLFIYSKMQVAGMQNTSAQKTSDLYAKIKYIYSMRGEGKGVIFATGTPVSNSIAELYTMQRYLQPNVLREKELDTFDRWASTFGEVINSVEISPTGVGFKQKERFAKFYNVPELTSLFRQCTDVVLKHQLNIPLPESHYHKIEIPALDSVSDYINEDLLPRAEAIAAKQVRPEEDNMLKVTNDGRKAALDIRMIYPNVEIDGPTKASVCTEKIFEVWKGTVNVKGTQLVFCDLGTPKKHKEVLCMIDNNETIDVATEDLLDDSHFDIYNEINKLLIHKGVPSNEITFIHDAKTPVQRAEMIEAFKKGEIRVLLGSTSKMGEGMNAQNKIVAIHHIDVPWKPSSLDQRDGRGIRSGNENDSINIYRYVTKGTFDAFSWQTIQTKATFISQILMGMSNERSIDDVDVQLMSFAEMKAAASDNPLILKKFELEVQLKKLDILEKTFYNNKYRIQNKVVQLQKSKETFSENLIKLKNDSKRFQEKDTHTIIIDGVERELNVKLVEEIAPAIDLLERDKELYLGDYLGMKMYGYSVNMGDGLISSGVTLHGEAIYRINYDSQLSLLRQLTGLKGNIVDRKIPKLIEVLNECIVEIPKLTLEYDKEFAYSKTVIDLRKDLQETNKNLGI